MTETDTQIQKQLIYMEKQTKRTCTTTKQTNETCEWLQQ